MDGKRVGNLEEFVQGKIHLVQVGQREVCLTRTEAGVFAFGTSCPHHQACLSDGTVGGTMLPSGPGTRRFGLRGQVLRCPRHGFEFDLASGEALFGTWPSRRLVTYECWVEGEDVFVASRPRSTANRAAGGD